MRIVFGSEFHEVHKARRSAINPFFSRSSVLRLEPMIQQRVQQMCDRFGDLGKRGEPVLLRDAFVAVTIDIVTEYCMMEPLHLPQQRIRLTVSSFRKKCRHSRRPLLRTALGKDDERRDRGRTSSESPARYRTSHPAIAFVMGAGDESAVGLILRLFECTLVRVCVHPLILTPIKT